MDSFCVVCLSKHRLLAKLNFYGSVYDLLVGNETRNVEDFHVCWECKSVLEKFRQFKERALQAQELLASYNLIGIQKEQWLEHNGSLSNLTIDTKIGYDFQFLEDENLGEAYTTESLNGLKIESTGDTEDSFQEMDSEFIERDPFENQMEESREEDSLNDEKSKEKDSSKEDNENDDEKPVRKKKKQESKMSILCKICNVTFKKIANLNRHNKSVHATNEESKCRICHKVYKSKIHLQSHERKVHSELFEPSQSCPDCSKVFKSKAYLKRHMVEVHPETNILLSCIKCTRSFKNEIYLKLHMKRAHTEENTVVCNICNKSCACKTYLRRHLEFAHQVTITPHVCPECTMPFNLEVTLQRHINVEHSNIEKIQCDMCEKTFTSVFNLKHHKYELHNPRNWSAICHLCSKTYKSINTLRRHMEVMHPPDDAAFTCYVCGDVFRCKIHLNKHVRQAHKNERSEEEFNRAMFAANNFIDQMQF